MFLSRIQIKNFRNFSELDIPLSGNVVVVGENRVGKSNLLYGLRLLLDPSLPDSARQLSMSDFWDGIDELDADENIVISVEIKDFENDLNVLALVTDFRLDDDPDTVRLTYEFRSKPDLDDDPTSDSDFEFVCYGGESESKRFGHELRRRLIMDVLPALRDAEGDLATWRRSPIRPLIENAFRDIDKESLEQIADSIGQTTAKIAEFDEIKSLEKEIASLFARMSGPKQDIKPTLGFSPTDPTRLYRNMRLLIDEGMRSISEASLGSANLVFLSLKTLEINQLIEENARDHTFLAIEEPEAHLHPHLQRSVYRHLFESVSSESPISVLLTTHSPHIASVAPLRSIVLLRDTKDDGTVGCSTASIALENAEVDDLARYIDVTRAEMLFARGVILVEGDAERFLVPAAARILNKPLDQLGITVCSVAGTNFIPYVKLLTGLDIPFAVMTDWDDLEGYDNSLGWTRSVEIVSTIEQIRTGKSSRKLLDELNKIELPDDFCERCAEFGVFSNYDTLEVDLFNDESHRALVAETLREGPFGAKRLGRIDEWEKSKKIDRTQFLSMIEEIGKGRFAQRLAARLVKPKPLKYIADAISFVAGRV
ncbi:MAG: AAA family ATPase [Alphaproteobacteria bacterium]|nr:AAA family ATPase [Alphaproteobacteria bacterium]